MNGFEAPKCWCLPFKQNWKWKLSVILQKKFKYFTIHKIFPLKIAQHFIPEVYYNSISTAIVVCFSSWLPWGMIISTVFIIQMHIITRVVEKTREL